MRIEVLDLGSNTFHLLTANVAGGCVVPVDDVSVPVRIGERAFAKGRITDKAYRRGIDAMGTLLDRCETVPVAVATGVFREAANAREFLDDVNRRFGLHVGLLSGEDEARLTYHGVRSEALEPDERLAVFDLGGGSLECLLGRRGRVELADSLPLGVLRFVGCEKDTLRARVTAVAGPIARAIRERGPDEVMLSSGTARALLRVARRLGGREHVVGCLSATTLAELARSLSTMSPRAIGAMGISAARSEVLGVGAIVLSTVVQLVGVPFVRIARGTLREGLALETAAASDLVARLRPRSAAMRRSA